MRHQWGSPTDPVTGRTDESYARTVPKSCFVGAHYCLRCEKVFCEHCNVDLYKLDDCEGRTSDQRENEVQRS